MSLEFCTTCICQIQYKFIYSFISLVYFLFRSSPYQVTSVSEITEDSYTNSQSSIWTLRSSQDKSTKKRRYLDSFVEACSLSPIKKTLRCNWENASERTKSDYIVKAEKILHDVVRVLAPGQKMRFFSHLLKEKQNRLI